jgi:hypothetical protein
MNRRWTSYIYIYIYIYMSLLTNNVLDKERVKFIEIIGFRKSPTDVGLKAHKGRTTVIQ